QVSVPLKELPSAAAVPDMARLEHANCELPEAENWPAESIVPVSEMLPRLGQLPLIEMLLPFCPMLTPEQSPTQVALMFQMPLVEAGRRAAALQVAEHDRSRLFAGQLGNGRTQLRADPAKPLDVLLVRRFLQDRAAALGKRALRHDDDAELRAPFVAGAQPLGDDVDVERDFRNEDRVRAACDAGVQGNPSGVAPHDLDDHDAMVRFGRRVQAIDRFGRKRDGGVEAETVRRADDIVVDGLRDADERDAALEELVADRERAVAADRD